MIIYLDNKNEWICFKFEKKDWKDKKRVEKFKDEVLTRIPDQHRLADPVIGKEILYKVEFEYAGLFGEILKKYYPGLYKNSIIMTK